MKDLDSQLQEYRQQRSQDTSVRTATAEAPALQPIIIKDNYPDSGGFIFRTDSRTFLNS